MSVSQSIRERYSQSESTVEELSGLLYGSAFDAVLPRLILSLQNQVGFPSILILQPDEYDVYHHTPIKRCLRGKSLVFQS